MCDADGQDDLEQVIEADYSSGVSSVLSIRLHKRKKRRRRQRRRLDFEEAFTKICIPSISR